MDRPGVPVAVEKVSCGWGILGGRVTCQGKVQVVGRSRPAAFLYRPVPVLVVKVLVLQTKIKRVGKNLRKVGGIIRIEYRNGRVDRTD